MLKKDDRLQKIRHRRNFFLTLIVTIAFWIVAGMFIYFTDPQTPGILPLFLTILFFAIFFTASILLVNRRRGLLIAISSVIFLILRYFGIGNILNLVLIVAIVISLDFYFAKNGTK